MFYLFNAYKWIKAPSAWTAKINFLENQAGQDHSYTFTALMDEVENYFNDLKNMDEWHPSDQSMEETIIAMLVSLKKPGTQENKQPKKPKNAKSKGKQKENDYVPCLPMNQERKETPRSTAK